MVGYYCHSCKRPVLALKHPSTNDDLTVRLRHELLLRYLQCGHIVFINEKLYDYGEIKNNGIIF